MLNTLFFRALSVIAWAPTAEAQFPAVLMSRDTALFIGRATGSPVSNAFVQPFAFTGTLNDVKVEWK